MGAGLSRSMAHHVLAGTRRLSIRRAIEIYDAAGVALPPINDKTREQLDCLRSLYFPHHAAPGSPCKAPAGGVMPEPDELVRRSTIATTVNLNSIQPDAE